MRPNESLTITVPEAGELLGLSRNAAYEAVARGEIPSVRVGKRILVPRAGIEQMLNEAIAKAQQRIGGTRIAILPSRSSSGE